MVQFALVWWLTQLTGSATVLATATMVALIPEIFLAPLAGAYVDRWSRRTIMIVADSAIALATVGLSVQFAAGAVKIEHVYLLMFIRAVGGCFHAPAMRASTSLMVPSAPPCCWRKDLLLAGFQGWFPLHVAVAGTVDYRGHGRRG